MIKKILIVLSVILLQSLTVLGQQPKIDSLMLVVENAKHDSVRVKALYQWDNLIFYTDPEKDFELNQEIESLCNKNLQKTRNETEIDFFNRYLSSAYSNMGSYYARTDQMHKAIQVYQKCLKTQGKKKNLKSNAGTLNNIGAMYALLGDNMTAIEYFKKALAIREKIKDERGVANSYDALGVQHAQQKDYTKAMDYFHRALKIMLKANDLVGIATSYNNIGNTYLNLGKINKARPCFLKSLEKRRQINDPEGKATCFNNIGEINFHSNHFADAIRDYDSAIFLSQGIGDNLGAATAMLNLAKLYLETSDIVKAIQYGEEGMAIAKKINVLIVLKQGSNVLSRIYKKANKPQNALEMKEYNTLLTDSLFNMNLSKELIQYEFKQSYEKKTLADSIQRSQQKILNSENERKEKFQKYMLFGGLALAIIFGIFILNRFWKISKQKKIIEDQKKELILQKQAIDEKQRELIDSIHYAKRIQLAILPSEKYISNHLKE
jgi:tetratricopeptide (TPR) repeat protein